MPTKPLKTPADGANAERKVFRAVFKRALNNSDEYSDVGALLSFLIDFADKRTERYNKRPGGLGKK